MFRAPTSRVSVISKTSARRAGRVLRRRRASSRNKLSLYASYAFVDATFRNALTLASNSPFADANGNIEVVPGSDSDDFRAIA